jgi:hypothetical protein
MVSFSDRKLTVGSLLVAIFTLCFISCGSSEEVTARERALQREIYAKDAIISDLQVKLRNAQTKSDLVQPIPAGELDDNSDEDSALTFASREATKSDNNKNKTPSKASKNNILDVDILELASFSSRYIHKNVRVRGYLCFCAASFGFCHLQNDPNCAGSGMLTLNRYAQTQDSVWMQLMRTKLPVFSKPYLEVEGNFGRYGIGGVNALGVRSVKRIKRRR